MRVEFEYIESDDLLIVSSPDEVFDEVSISADKFWRFVCRHGLNEWCTDFFDPGEPNAHGQRTGKYDKKTYLELNHSLIEKDLIKYLEVKNFFNKNSGQ